VFGKAQLVINWTIPISLFRVLFYQPRERRHINIYPFRADFVSWTVLIVSCYGKNTTFRKMDPFPSSGEKLEKHLLQLLQRWWYFEYDMMDKSRNKVFLSVVYFRKRPLGAT
jgi:hypothetical protein